MDEQLGEVEACHGRCRVCEVEDRRKIGARGDDSAGQMKRSIGAIPCGIESIE